MALSVSLPQTNLGVQGETQGGLHSGTQRVNPEFRVGSSFRIIPEQYFSGVENVVEFLANIDDYLTYYEIHAQLAYAYLTLQLDRTDFSSLLERLRKWTARIFLPSSNVFESGLAALF
ncbi:uncharacterized protein TNCV_3212931 [Trichonephila clavipes]|nr:uncharacterized protein TNCV_3212931 [Trichonephila clavipes]